MNERVAFENSPEWTGLLELAKAHGVCLCIDEEDYICISVSGNSLHKSLPKWETFDKTFWVAVFETLIKIYST